MTADLVEVVFLHLGQILAVIKDLAGFDNGVVGQNAHDGLDTDGFAGAGFADDGQRFAPIQIKADTSDSLHQTAVCTETDPQIPHGQDHVLFRSRGPGCFGVHHFRFHRFSHTITPLRVSSGRARRADRWRTG